MADQAIDVAAMSVPTEVAAKTYHMPKLVLGGKSAEMAPAQASPRRTEDRVPA